MQSQSHTEIIKASIDICFDTIVDFARYPEWFNGVTTAEIEEAEAVAGTWRVAYTLNMIIKTISYTLAYHSERPTLLTWRSVAGDIAAIEGIYQLVKLEDGITEATCTQSIDVGFWIPGPLKRTFEHSALAESVREFKAAAEARVG